MIACPCALVVATPVAVVASLAAAARHGVLLKGGHAVEAPAGLRTVALDKTGTITRGRPAVVEVVPLAEHDERGAAGAGGGARGGKRTPAGAGHSGPRDGARHPSGARRGLRDHPRQGRAGANRRSTVLARVAPVPGGARPGDARGSSPDRGDVCFGQDDRRRRQRRSRLRAHRARRRGPAGVAGRGARSARCRSAARRPAHRRPCADRERRRERSRDRRGPKRAPAGGQAGRDRRADPAREAPSRWSATASTTLPHWPAPRSASRWAPAPTPRSRPPTSRCCPTTWGSSPGSSGTRGGR